jgi:hypothetical protein
MVFMVNPEGYGRVSILVYKSIPHTAIGNANKNNNSDIVAFHSGNYNISEI